MRAKIKILKQVGSYQAGQVVDATLYSVGSHVFSDTGWKLPCGTVAWCRSYDTETAIRYGYWATKVS